MIIIVFFSAFTGWLISWLTIQLLFLEPSQKKQAIFKIQGVVPAYKSKFGIKLGQVFQQEFESPGIIEEKISDDLLFEKLKPEIEKHVDFFLKEKLATIFPLLYKFMGEKTLLQFKDAFMVEIDLLFPVIIKNYIASLKVGIRLDKIISERIDAIPLDTIRQAFFENAKKEILRFKFICTLIGLLTGLVTILILRLIPS